MGVGPALQCERDRCCNTMLWSAVAATLVLAASAQDYVDSGYENRRRGSVDEDAGNYEYDYAPDNGLGPTVELGQGIRREPEPRPPPSRLAPAPKRQSFKPRPSDSGYRPRNRAPTGLVGKESCKSGAKSVGHESACDLYYDCYEGQGFLQSCPNGLVYGGDGRFGHVTSCTRYWTCWNGTATEQFCIGGLLYNEETHACDWPQNVAGCQKHPLCKDDANGNVPLGKSCNRYWACQGGY